MTSERGQFFEFHHGRVVRLGHRRGTRIDLFEFAQEPGRFGQPAQDRGFAFAEFLGDAGGQFDQPAAVGGARVAGLEFVLLVGAQGGVLDLFGLMAQEGEFAFERGLVGGEAGVFLAQPTHPAPDVLVLPGGCPPRG